ncbi:hypothetical protein F2Q70_00019787 [Brassica cretica]|uniref:mRNA export factor GLE1 n=1 Tax=Brassica cretica TaxID=69181 RepID=A0A8S9GFY1_BRACR|nr:hypothetical protein F2Q70_00019787 [Brassica cretica]
MWKRFACDELEVLNTNSSSLLPCLMVTSCSYSDESDDEIDCVPESFLMSNVGLAETALYETTQLSYFLSLFWFLSMLAKIRAAEKMIVTERERVGGAGSSATLNAQAGGLGKSIQAAESALTLEKHRLKKLEELEALNQSLKSCSNEIVSTQDPFAGSYVILYVTSQPGWDSDAYHRLASTVRRYGALVQTDICGGNAHNIHGIEHGWAWFARFLNKISAYRGYCNSLKRISPDGRVWSIHQRYKSQFLKAVNVVREHFLPKLRAKKDAANLQTIITDITAYLDYQIRRRKRGSSSGAFRRTPGPRCRSYLTSRGVRCASGMQGVLRPASDAYQSSATHMIISGLHLVSFNAATSDRTTTAEC